MTRARRITQGERTASEIVHDPANPQIMPTEPQVGQRIEPDYDRFCKRCEAVADPNTAYGVAVASTGTAHYTADQDRTLCGRDLDGMTIT